MMDRLAFLHKFFLQPQKIGSLTPSSSFLTKKMLQELPWKDIRAVAELGPGTGVFTEYIASHKQKDCPFLVLEQDRDMRTALQERFPSFYYGSRAEGLERQRQRMDLPQFDCVVSGIPFAALPEDARREIIAAVHQSLNDQGVFVAFQYSLQMRGMLKEHFRSVTVGFVPWNIPPAFVYFCRK